MDRENRRDERAPPNRAGHLPQNKKEQDRRRRVEQDIGEMMSARAQTIKLSSPAYGKSRSPDASWRHERG